MTFTFWVATRHDTFHVKCWQRAWPTSPVLSRLVDPNRRIADGSVWLHSEAKARVRGLEAKTPARAVVAEKAVSPADGLASRSATICVPGRAEVNTLVQANCWYVDCVAGSGVDDGLTAYLAEVEVCRAELGGIDGVV
jgi:hypothetical protein